MWWSGAAAGLALMVLWHRRQEAVAAAGEREVDESFVDQASDDSFPASDPPAWSGSSAVAGPVDSR